MTTVATLPFYGQLPAGYQPSAPAPAPPPATSTPPAAATDTLATPKTLPAARVTAKAGDLLSASALLSATAARGGSIAGYRVALRGDSDGAALLLGTADVTGQTRFTADEFARLHIRLGASQGQDLVVVAQSGSRDSTGTLRGTTDSTAVQITLAATGQRSLAAAAALLGATTDGFVGVAQESGIFTGTGGARPTLTTVGNVTTAAGDLLSLSDLYAADPATAGYRVALRGGSGTLLLGTADVTGRTSFTADEFARLHYQAGASGSDDLVVVAQSGSRDSTGALHSITDSPAVAVTLAATGTRSVNVAGALLGASDAFSQVAQEASIFTGTGGTRPTLTTVGNVTTAAGDLLSVASLTSGESTASGYRVALRGGSGTLLLGTADVTGRTSFTADEFARLHYQAGASGSDDLVVVAQTGSRDSAGTLHNVTDSTAVAITLAATGTRSVNVAGALLGATDSFTAVAQEASIFTGNGGTRPTLSTVGNLTAAAGDLLSLSSLYQAEPATAGYRVALRGGNGTLLLGTADVTGRTSFTADEFAKLHYQAGASGSDDLVVVAQSGSRDSAGTLHGITDSAAVAITLATGTRSLNAAAALLGASDPFTAVAQEASIFTGTGTGTGSARPTLSTVGNVTTAAGDLLSLSSLYQADPATAGYRVALRGGSGTLLLGTADVTGRTSFTADEFAKLHYQAGTSGSDDLVVVVQSGSRDSAGTLRAITDSAAVGITLAATGTRSVNVAGALLGATDAFTSVAQEASIFTGTGGARPTLAALATAPPETVSASAIGAFQATGLPLTAATYDPGLLGDGIGGAVTSGPPSAAQTDQQTAALLLGGTGVGAYRTAGGAASALTAILAYQASRR